VRTLGRPVSDSVRLVYLSARLIAGRWFWVTPLVPLLWTAFLALRLLVGWRTEEYAPWEVQNALLGMPLAVLAIGLGVRVIAGEIDRRTLEIAYTAPGGAHRVWIAKLGAAALILLVAEGLLAGAAALFFTAFPWGALYVPFQAALFYLTLSMALSALLKSEVAGALISIPALFLGLVASPTRFSPFFNPWIPETVRTSAPADILAWTVQNRIGFALAIAAVAALGFARAERREQMMSG
jgi:ABC-type transport system involved in multi-copper enzyme maturation permease subunit